VRVISVEQTAFVQTGSEDQILFVIFSRSRHIIPHYTNTYNPNVLHFPKVYNHTPVCDYISSGAIVDPASRFPLSVMLALPIAENLKVRL
jgi:hypothetical protein